MDFSAYNPLVSNALNIAAREQEVAEVERLLGKINPNCVDNRGWTCLHEAAANDRYQCVELILKHPDCRPLAETFEGHTALYLACRNKCSISCIKLILDSVEDIAQYASTEMVSPLHLACQQGNTELVELLLQYNSIVDLQDFDGDSPLHDAAFQRHSEVVSILLHAGAEPELRNTSGYTPFHLACMQGSLDCIRHLHPFSSDINIRSSFEQDTPLTLATHKGNVETLMFLLQHGADPNLRNTDDKDALTTALSYGNAAVFRELLKFMDRDNIVRDIFLMSCKPNYFNLDIIVALLESDLGPEYFNECEMLHINLPTLECPSQLWYSVNPPLNFFLKVANYIYKRSPELLRKLLYLLLMRGVHVNALTPDECPPLAYLHFCDHDECFDEVFKILVSHGCNVDYNCGADLPDVFLASMATGSDTMHILIQHSLALEPDYLKNFLELVFLKINNLTIRREKIYELMGPKLSIMGEMTNTLTLQHLCRLRIRQTLRECDIKTTKDFIDIVNRLPLPRILIDFMRYL